MLVVHHPSGMPEVQLSLGRVRRLEDGFVHYDADTMGGSGGAPVLAAPDLGVLAMHVGRGPADINFALPLAAVLDGLRGAADWPEIARLHGLADVAAAREPVAPPPAAAPAAAGDAVVAAALRWSFDPGELSDADREAVRPLVVDAGAPRWSITLDHRQRLLREAGSLDALRALRRRHPGTEPGAEVIDRIVAGPPYDLDALPLDTLPRWLQAVRWFDGTVPELPTAGPGAPDPAAAAGPGGPGRGRRPGVPRPDRGARAAGRLVHRAATGSDGAHRDRRDRQVGAGRPVRRAAARDGPAVLARLRPGRPGPGRRRVAADRARHPGRRAARRLHPTTPPDAASWARVGECVRRRAHCRRPRAGAARARRVRDRPARRAAPGDLAGTRRAARLGPGDAVAGERPRPRDEPAARPPRTP